DRAQLFDRNIAAHQRFAHEHGIHAACFHSRSVLRGLDSAFAYQNNFVRNIAAESFGDRKIDIERGEVAVVNSDNLGSGFKSALQLIDAVDFDERIEPKFFGAFEETNELVLSKRRHN